GRNRPEGERVADQDVSILPGDDRLPDHEPGGGEDVPLLAVRVGEERDPRGAVRVVLDRRDLRGDPILVPPEIEDPVATLVAAAAVPDRDEAAVVAAARAGLLHHK